MSQLFIRQAFDAKLKAWADKQSPPIPIAWENIRFDPPAGRYLQAYLLPNDTVSLSLDRTHRMYRGYYQVTIVEPVNQDPRLTDALVGELERLFNPSMSIEAKGLRIQLTEPMSASPPLQNANRYLVPVSAPYRCDVDVTAR